MEPPDPAWLRLVLAITLWSTCPAQEVSPEPCTVEGFGDSGCGGYRNLLSDCGVLKTVGFPGHDYPNNSLCEWHIHVSPRHRIILSIDVFEMEESGPECVYDYFSVFDGVSENARMLGKLCGAHAPFIILSSRNHLFLKFSSDSSVTSRGLYASYISEEIGLQSAKPLIALGPPLLPTPGFINFTRDDFSEEEDDSFVTRQYLIQSRIRERVVLEWTIIGGKRRFRKSCLEIFSGDAKAEVADLSVRCNESRSSSGVFRAKGHRVYLQVTFNTALDRLKIYLRHYGEDTLDKLPPCISSPGGGSDVGKVNFDDAIIRQNLPGRGDDIYCQASLSSAAGRHLSTSFAYVINPQAAMLDSNITTGRMQLSVYDGKSEIVNTGDSFLHPKLPLPIVSRGAEIVLVYWSDNANGRGQLPTIQAQFSPTDCSDFSHLLVENTTISVTEKCGSFRQAPQQAPTNLDYHILIESKSGNNLKLDFPPLSAMQDVQFVCKGMKDMCEEDLQVYDHSGDIPMLIYSYCRDRNPEWRTVLSSSSSVEVVYRSRCAWSRSGFFFTFRETLCERAQTTTCGPRVNLDASCGTIFSPTNSSATTCEWLVTSTLGQSIVMLFQPIRLRSDGDVDDYVTIKEGAKNGGFQTTNELTENYDIFPYLSTTNQVLIKLSKGQNGTQTSFVAHYWMEEEAKFVKDMEDVYLSEELCEPGFTHYRGNCYQVVASLVPLWWESAQQRCSDVSANLASITSPYEMKFIERLARESLAVGGSAPIMAFIGLRSKGTSGRYAWVDGSDVTFTRWQWRPAEPAGQGKTARSCTLMTIGRKEGDLETGWYPVPCDYPRAGRDFICKAGARGCGEGWTLVGSTCLKLFRLKGQEIHYDRICTDIGSTVALVNHTNKLPLIQEYLDQSWPRFPEPKVFMQIKEEGTATCNVLEKEEGTGQRWEVATTECYRRLPTHVLCSMQKDAKTCPAICSCFEDTVSCAGKGLEQLPDMIHKTTRKLLLGSNKLNFTTQSFTAWHLLSSLDLSNNSIQQLPENVFGTLHTLLLLNLSGNLITALRSSSFSGLEKLQVLDVSGNNIDKYDRDVFDHMKNLRLLVADDDTICCLAPRVNVCTAEKDPTSTCDHLIASNVLRITTWVLGLLSILGNPTVVLQHLRTKQGGAWTAFLCNLAVADFCTGLYLLVIGSADAFFRGEYIFYTDHWISSTMCASAAVVFTFSKMSSLFLVGAMMLENHVFPRLPIKYLTNRMHSPSVVASVCWTLSFCCTITLTISSQLTGYYIGSRTGLCTPVLTTVLSSTEPGWKYVFFVYTVLPATVMVLTTLSSIIAFFAGKPNPLANDLYFSKDSGKEKKLRLGLKGLLVLNYLCWTVVVITGILTRVGEKISPDLAVWTALFLMTISAGIDPFIHLASLADFSSDKREATNCAEANGNIVNTFVDSLGRRVYKASSGTLRNNGSDQTEEKQAIKAYLQCLSVDVETNFVVKLILQFRSYSTVLVEGSATQEMSVLRRIGESGGHQNIVRQCVIPEIDAYRWVLYTVYENCKLKEVIPTLSSEDLLTISLDMSKALHFLHQENIALGKLTLDGVLVEKIPHIKVVIADFTSAKIVSTGETAQKSFQADFDEWQRLRTMIIRKSAYATLSCRL
ncbi:uncharacterized protein LOC144924913 [Branchiostoma floridae x Branchiostoma belcheri]